MLHITNGEATKTPLEQSGLPGRFFSWDDILHEGPTPLVSGDEWLRVRAKYLASAGYGDEGEIYATYAGKDALEHLDGSEQNGATRRSGSEWSELERGGGAKSPRSGDRRASREDEVVFWFEHDLYDQLLLIRHLWWIDTKGRGRAGKYSIVMGTDYLGMLKPEDFPPRFERRQSITEEQIALGSAAWQAYCGDDPGKLVAFSDLPAKAGSHASSRAGSHASSRAGSHASSRAGSHVSSRAGSYTSVLPYLGRAMHRLLEEFPSTANGLSRCERQILEVLAEGDRSPEQTFIQASTREEDIWLGDWSFWTIAKRLNAGPYPLLTLDVEPRENRLPTGTLAITGTGRRVLAGDADHVALNGISRWIGGTLLTPARCWRWTGSSLRPPAP